MKLTIKDPPRLFSVGVDQSIQLRDCGSIELEPDEQVTFVENSSEYDVCKKDWGYYATPSLNGRLPNFDLRPALILNPETGRYFVTIVFKDKVSSYIHYLKLERLEHLCWLDEEETLAKIKKAVK